MIKKMTKHGNSWAIVIDRSVLELLKISPSDPLDVSTDGKCLIVSPINDPKRRQKLARALTKTNQKYSRMYQRLAEAPGALS